MTVIPWPQRRASIADPGYDYEADLARHFADRPNVKASLLPATAISEAERMRRTYAAKFERTTAPGDVGATVAASSVKRSTFPGCTGPCNQGRQPCPSPMACQIAVDEPSRLDAATRSMQHFRSSRWGLWLALLGVPALVVAIGLISVFWPLA